MFCTWAAFTREILLTMRKEGIENFWDLPNLSLVKRNSKGSNCERRWRHQILRDLRSPFALLGNEFCLPLFFWSFWPEKFHQVLFFSNERRERTARITHSCLSLLFCRVLTGKDFFFQAKMSGFCRFAYRDCTPLLVQVGGNPSASFKTIEFVRERQHFA